VAATAHEHAPGILWTGSDRVLFVALAEALGYGRDREALRDAGRPLVEHEPPDALLAEGLRLPRVERLRLNGLLALYERWYATGPWSALRPALEQGSPQQAGRALIERLRVPGGSVSRGRAAILSVNVVLSFAAAYAALTQDPKLGERVSAIYMALGRLPANQITREMRRQLGLRRMPSGAAAQ
jgi:hypothetical protein